MLFLFQPITLLKRYVEETTEEKERAIVENLSSEELREKMRFLDQLYDWMEPAIREVKFLILRDSWPRFINSPYYSEFSDMLANENEFLEAIQDIFS